jgi:hypothetical protein
LFDVGINQRYDQASFELSPPPPIPSSLEVRRSFSIVAGPGFRRFTRPAEALSPYWDVRLRGRYARYSFSGFGDLRRRDTGIEADFSFGLEYATPWRFSVAAHSGLARATWLRTVEDRTSAGVDERRTLDGETISIGLSPVLYVRAYF